MDIEYRKDTLYVHLNENIDKDKIESLETKVDNIMKTYDIGNLVINTRGKGREHLHEFEWKYNSRHRTNVIIK